MRKSLVFLSSCLIGIFFIVIVIGNVVIVAQDAVTGTWKADTRVEKDDDGQIHISFNRSSGRGHDNNFGSNFKYADLQGLSREQTQNGKVSFRLVREAGTVECEGSFSEGKGSGTFRFLPDAGYIAAMRSRGFDFEKTSAKHEESAFDKQFAAALINVTTALADDLRSVGFGPLDVDDLFKAAIFKVDSKFMAEMKATGFPDLKMEDLVKARIFKIDADYVRQVNEMGFAGKNFESLVKFRIFKVTPEFLSELKSYGFNDLSSEEVVKFRIFNIDAAFIQKAKAADPNVSVEDMVRMKIGVKRMKDDN